MVQAIEDHFTKVGFLMGSGSVKVCGITREEDAGLALELGAEKLGLYFV